MLRYGKRLLLNLMGVWPETNSWLHNLGTVFKEKKKILISFLLC